MRVRGLIKGLAMVGAAGLILSEVEKFQRKIDELTGLMRPPRRHIFDLFDSRHPKGRFTYERISRPINLQTRDMPSYLLESREDAHKLLDVLSGLSDKYGTVTLADVHNLLGLATSSGDMAFGWPNFNHFDTRGWITQTRDGWKVAFPSMERL